VRPVNKGETPYVLIKNYGEALPYLEERIGCYCSYCEFPISHVPEVEHIFAKSKGGSLTEWANLLLVCKYCNTRKGTIIGDNIKEIWLWPDINNTFLAFTYDGSKPKVNENFMKNIDESLLTRAKIMFADLKLDNIPLSPNDKDRRWMKRLNTYNKAKEYFNDWQMFKNSKYEGQLLKCIFDLAKSEGFFSVWMNIFADEPEVCNGLINSFIGTDKNSFDNNGKPVIRVNGEI